MIFFITHQDQGGNFRLPATFMLHSVFSHLDEILLQKNFPFVFKINPLRTSGLYIYRHVSMQIKFPWKQRFTQKCNALYIERIHQVTNGFLWKVNTYSPLLYNKDDFECNWKQNTPVDSVIDYTWYYLPSHAVFGRACRWVTKGGQEWTLSGPHLYKSVRCWFHPQILEYF